VKSFARLAVLLVFCLTGCHHENGSSDGSANQTPTASAAATSNQVMSRVPAPVAAAFARNHANASATRVHVRLFPDGTTHYQIMYVDGDGQPQEADYYLDGRKVPQ
jgi:hypothetical protein